jgi:hypothetical protein
MKLVAKNPITGLYFNGVNFTEKSAKNAIALRPGTTAEDFSLMWTCDVVIEEI